MTEDPIFYVDRLFNHGWKYGPSCHLMTTGDDEDLIRFANRMQLNPTWIQNPGTATAHFDLTEKKRAQAVRFGAAEADAATMSKLIKLRRERCRST